MANELYFFLKKYFIYGKIYWADIACESFEESVPADFILNSCEFLVFVKNLKKHSYSLNHYL